MSTGREKVEVREVTVSRLRVDVVRRVEVQKAYEIGVIEDQNKAVKYCFVQAGWNNSTSHFTQNVDSTEKQWVGRRQGHGLPLAWLGLALSARLTSERHFFNFSCSLAHSLLPLITSIIAVVLDFDDCSIRTESQQYGDHTRADERSWTSSFWLRLVMAVAWF